MARPGKLAILIALLLSAGLMAEVPQLISYQGRITDSSGKPVPDGTYEITVSIYDVETGGIPFWAETLSTVVVQNGLFNVILGATTPFGPSSVKRAAPAAWLGMSIGSEPEFVPRSQLVSVPFAFDADRADTSQYSYNAQNSAYSDTAFYTHNAVWSDTAGYASGALWSDSADYSFSSNWADTSDHARSVADGSVDSGSIVDGSIAFSDIGPNGAADGQIIKWNSALSSWETVDETVGSGDITAVNAGSGLAGGGTSGDVALGIPVGGVTSSHIQDGSIQAQDLGSFSAADGQMLKWNSALSSWEAVDDAGDISAVTAGSGLTGGGTSGDVSLSLSANAIDSTHIKNSSISNADIADDAITGDKIALYSITGIDIATGAINNAKIEDGTIVSQDIADGQVLTADIGNIQVTNEKIYPNAVTTDKIADLAITDSKLSSLSVTNSKIGSNAITSDKIADNTITGGDIADNTISSTQIADDNISAIDLLDEPGIAHSVYGGTKWLTETVVALDSIIISCPSAGYVIVTSSFEGRIENGIGGSTTLSFEITSGQSMAYPSKYDPGTGDRRSGLSIHKVYTISGPGDRTFYLRAKKTGTATTTTNELHLTGLFVPTAY